MNRRSVLRTMGGALAVSFGLAGCTGDGTSDSTAQGSTGSDSGSGSGSDSDSSDGQSSSQSSSSTSDQYDYYESGVGLTNIGPTEGEYGNLSLTGTATNTTDTELSYVQISVAFLDETDAQVGTSMANTNNLAPGQRWRWEAMYMDMDTSAVASATITGIDAF